MGLGLASLVFAPLPAASLTAPPGLDSLEETDREALERIAVQPAPLREAALLATQHVDTLVEVQRIQEQSSADFQERIEGLDRETQEQLWEIVREPGLLVELAGQGPRSSAQLDAIAAEHPAALAPAIRSIGAEHAQLLGHVFSIQDRANERFELLLRDLPDDASRQAFRDLLAEPELLSVMARRVHLAVRLGDSFREDPATTRAHLAALGEEVAASEALAREQWVKSIADDPEAASELEESARAYADEYGYDYDELTEPDVRTRIEIVVHPYPFWFGYPYWYADAYLFPYGYWYHYPPHFGFYHHHHHHNYVWFGLPSVHFAYWFFGGHHDRHYRHLSHGFDRHYARHHGGGIFHQTLGNWVHWRDRDHRHRSGGGHHRSGGRESFTRSGGDDGFFVSLFERARFDRDAGHRPTGFDERRDRIDGRRPGGDRDRESMRRDARRDPREGIGRDDRSGRRDRGGDASSSGRRERRDEAAPGERIARPDPRERRDGERADRNRDGDGQRTNRDGDGQRTNRDRDGDRTDRGGDRSGERVDRSHRGWLGENARRGGDRADRPTDRGMPRVARPDRQDDGPRIRIRDHRDDARSQSGGPSMQRREQAPRPMRERGVSSRAFDRGPSMRQDRGGPRGGGPDVGARGGGGNRGGNGHSRHGGSRGRN